MSVQPVNNISQSDRIRNLYNCSKMAGYVALGTGGLCLIQGMRYKKSHKVLGLISVSLAALHIALIQALHNIRPKS